MIAAETRRRQQVGFVADIEPLVDGLYAGDQPGVERGGYRDDDALT